MVTILSAILGQQLPQLLYGHYKPISSVVERRFHDRKSFDKLMKLKTVVQVT